ncbi:MAG: hypothetical protein ACI8PB_002529 [Desulforhopalus sp.]|jgi:hypothetical protein
MKIQGNPDHSAHAYGQIKQQQQAKAEQTNTPKPSDSIEAETSSQATSTDQLNIGEAKGVIRHLQEGHYQGVAQLRLSIVHAERFQQAASQATVEVLDAEGEQLTTAVRDKIALLYTPLNNPDELDSGAEALASLDVEGAIKAFEETVASGKEGSESGKPAIETFRDLYSTAFRALIDKLEPVDYQPVNDIAAPVQPVPGDEDEGNVTTDEFAEGDTTQPPQAATDVAQEQAGITVDLTALEDWFNGVLDSSVEAIQNQVATVSAPPLSSQPAGNGAAYEKFMAVYEEFYGTTEQQPNSISPRETDPIDTEA